MVNTLSSETRNKGRGEDGAKISNRGTLTKPKAPCRVLPVPTPPLSPRDLATYLNGGHGQRGVGQIITTIPSSLSAPGVPLAIMNYSKKDEDADSGLIKVDRTQVFQEGWSHKRDAPGEMGGSRC